MLVIDIREVSEADALRIQVKGFPGMTRETVETLGDMDSKAFDEMIIELRKTILGSKIVQGKDITNVFK